MSPSGEKCQRGDCGIGNKATTEMTARLLLKEEKKQWKKEGEWTTHCFS